MRLTDGGRKRTKLQPSASGTDCLIFWTKISSKLKKIYYATERAGVIFASVCRRVGKISFTMGKQNTLARKKDVSPSQLGLHGGQRTLNLLIHSLGKCSFYGKQVPTESDASIARNGERNGHCTGTFKRGRKTAIAHEDKKTTKVHSNLHKMPRGMMPVMFVNEHSNNNNGKDSSVSVQSKSANQTSSSGQDVRSTATKLRKPDKDVTVHDVLSSLKNKLGPGVTGGNTDVLSHSKAKTTKKSVVYKVLENTNQKQVKTVEPIQPMKKSLSLSEATKNVDASLPKDANASDKQVNIIQQIAGLFEDSASSQKVQPIEAVNRLAKICVPIFRYSVLVEKDLKLFRNWAKQVGQSQLQLKTGTHVCEVFVKDVFLAHGYGNDQGQAQKFAIAGCIDILKTSNIEIVSSQRQVNETKCVLQLAVTCNPAVKDLLPPVCSSCDNDVTGSVKSLSKFVVRQRPGDNAIVTINQSAQFNNVQFDYRCRQAVISKQPVWECTVVLNNSDVASGFGPIQKSAKLAAAEKALKCLKKQFPTVVVESVSRGDVNQALSRDDVLKSKSFSDKEIGEENVGNQLLRKMGWSGTGGLGKTGEGRVEPVQCQETLFCSGLGNLSTQKNFVSFSDASRILQEYVAQNSSEELTFSPELTNEERKKIHLMARKFGLQSKSFGKGETRYLMVSRKVDASHIVKELCEAGGSKKGLHLLAPGSQI